MAATALDHPPRARLPRSDGLAARARLLKAALGLFSQKGFTKTSTREIAQAAGVNIAAISYYFGDKAGLYRVVFTEPLGHPADDIALFNQQHLTLHEALQAYFTRFLEPMKQGDLIQQCMRLHFREMLEPTGLSCGMDEGIKASHAALVAVLCRHLGLARADDEAHRLAFAVSALALQMFVGRDLIEAVRPRLASAPRAIDLAAQRLADWAEAMVLAEARRRAALSSPPTGAIRPTPNAPPVGRTS
ncbi:MAG: CerR family C-terminal domain-containing protein [Ramlibacter sp.]|nr:CerR family C-terminal domain-containing protein [Ramlibacter sp.]